jgi:predicted GNAT family acetyltransferase
MEISHEENKKKGSFFIEENGDRVAEIQYFHSNTGQITVYHTEVGTNLRGKGVGEKLVERVVGFARENGLKINATCPFAHKLIENDPENKDILI